MREGRNEEGRTWVPLAIIGLVHVIATLIHLDVLLLIGYKLSGLLTIMIAWFHKSM
jgi:hypothetical protein